MMSIAIVALCAGAVGFGGGLLIGAWRTHRFYEREIIPRYFIERQ